MIVWTLNEHWMNIHTHCALMTVANFSVVLWPEYSCYVFSKRIYIGSGAGYSLQRLQSTAAAAGRVLHISTFPDGLAAPSLESNVQTFCGKHRALIGPDRLILPPHWPRVCGRHFGKLCFCPDDCAAKVVEFKHCPTHQKARDSFMNYIMLIFMWCTVFSISIAATIHGKPPAKQPSSQSVLPNMTLQQARCMLHAVKVLLTGYIGLQPGQGSGGLLPASASSWTCQDIQNLDDDTPNPNLYMLSKFNYSFISSTYNLKVQLILQKKTIYKWSSIFTATNKYSCKSQIIIRTFRFFFNPSYINCSHQKSTFSSFSYIKQHWYGMRISWRWRQQCRLYNFKLGLDSDTC